MSRNDPELSHQQTGGQILALFNISSFELNDVCSMNLNDARTVCLFCLFVLLLYVPSQQLWSLRDGQST